MWRLQVAASYEERNTVDLWYVRKGDEAACKHYEPREDMVKLMEERGLE